MKQAACESARLSVSSGRASTKRRGNAARKTGVVLFGNCVPANSNLRRASRRIKTPARRVLRPAKAVRGRASTKRRGNAARKTGAAALAIAPRQVPIPPRFPPHQNAGAARFASAKAVRGRASAKRRGNAARKTGAAPWQLRPRQVPIPAALPAASKRRRGAFRIRKSGPRPRIHKAPRETRPAKRALSSLAIAPRQIPTLAALPAASKRRRGASCARKSGPAAAHPQSAAETQPAKRALSSWQLRPGKFQPSPRFPPHQNAGAARLAPAKAVCGRGNRKRRGNAARKTSGGRPGNCAPASSNPRRAGRASR